MAGNNEEVFGARFEIDATDLKRGITDANRYIRMAESEFRAAAAGMDDWRKSEDGLNAKMKQLTQTSQAQQAKVKALQAEYQRLAQEYGANSSEAQAMAIRVNNATAAYNKTQKEIRQTEQAMSELGGESETTGTALKKTGDDAERAGSKFGGLGDKAKTAAKALAATIAALPAAIIGLSKSTEEYSQDLSTLENAFTTQGHSVQTAHKVYKDFYGLLGETDQSVEAANNLARLTTNQDDLAKWTNISAGAFSQFQDALPIENLSEAAQETAHTGQVVGGLADALNWSTKTNKEFSASMNGHGAAQAAFNKALAEGATKEDAFNAALAACSTEQERSSLITDTLNGLYGEAGQKYRENNKDLIAAREAQDAWNSKLAEAGEAVRPISTALQELGTKLLSEAIPSLQEFAKSFSEKLQPAFDTFRNDVLPPVRDAFQWLIDKLPTIGPIVAGIATGFLAFNTITTVVNGVKGAMTAWKLATDGLKLSQVALNLVMAANPFVLVASLIAGLVAAFVLLWNTNEGFRKAVTSAWEGIKQAATSVFGYVRDFLSSVWSGIKATASSVWSGIKSLITGAANGIKTGVVNYINALKASWSAVFSGIKAISSSIWNGIKSTVLGVAGAMKNGVSTVLNGIKSTASNVWSGIRSAASSAWNGIKSAIEKPINKAKEAVRSAISAIKGFFNFKFKWPHVPLPHFSVSPKGWKVGDLLKGSIPSLGIKWYAKGAIFDRPTLLATPNGLKGLGEAGPEAAAPISELLGYVRQAVREEMGDGRGKTVTFTQNNYSPKALSPYDTYRQGLKVAQNLAAGV